MEGSDALSLRETIVLASVDDQLGSGPLVDVVRWAEPASSRVKYSQNQCG